MNFTENNYFIISISLLIASCYEKINKLERSNENILFNFTPSHLLSENKFFIIQEQEFLTPPKLQSQLQSFPFRPPYILLSNANSEYAELHMRTNVIKFSSNTPKADIVKGSLVASMNTLAKVLCCLSSKFQSE